MGDMGTMGDKLATLTTVLYYLCWPFIALFRALRSILTPFWTIAQFILLPITYLAHTLFTIALFPFRMHLLDRFEVSLTPSHVQYHLLAIFPNIQGTENHIRIPC
jgi:hypothetical protein